MNTRSFGQRALGACTLLSLLGVSSGAWAAGGASPLPSPPSSKADDDVVKAPSSKFLPAPAAFQGAPLTVVPAFAAERSVPSDEKRILGLRLPAFIAFGLGSLGAGGAIATGVAIGSRGNDPRTCDSRCTDHTVSDRTLYITTAVLSGVAAAGVGLGVAFIIGAPSRSARLKLDMPRPTLGFGISSEKAVAKVGWRF